MSSRRTVSVTGAEGRRRPRAYARVVNGLFDGDPIDVARERFERRGLGEPDVFVAMSSVMRTYRRMTDTMEEVLGPLGLTPTSYMLVMTVRFTDEGALSLSEIGRALMVHPATVTVLVDQLEKQGVLERRPNPRDRRATLATLTAKGRRDLARATKALAARDFGLPDTGADGANAIVEALRPARLAGGDAAPIP